MKTGIKREKEIRWGGGWFRLDKHGEGGVAF